MIRFISMAVIPFPQWTLRSSGLCSSIIYSWCIQRVFLYRNISIWLQRHLASHRKPVRLFSASRATSCVCDLPCCVDVTRSVSAAVNLSLKYHTLCYLTCCVDVTRSVSAAVTLSLKYHTLCDLTCCVDVTRSVSAAVTLSLKYHILYDPSCWVDVTCLVNAATRCIVVVFSSWNTSYTIRVVLYWSKVHSYRRGQTQKLIRMV
jgi:hypothetical protein